MIKLEGFKKQKRMGRFGENAVGVAVNVNAEVVKAEYSKNNDGVKLVSKGGGNNQITLFCRVSNTITKKDGGTVTIPTYFNVKYYETEFSPTLKEILPTDKLKKFVGISLSNGGDGFGTLKVRNYIGKDNKPKTTVEIFGGNVKKTIKKNGIYYIETFHGEEPFLEDRVLNVTYKGVFQPIKDTESFMINNYNEKAEELRVKMYFDENEGDAKFDNSVDLILDHMTKDRVGKFVTFFKENTTRIIGIKGKVVSKAIYGKEDVVVSQEIGEYSFGGKEIIGYEVSVLVDYDEDVNNWVIKKSDNEGKLVLDGQREVVEKDDSDLFPF